MSLDIRKILKDQGWKLEHESSTAYFYNHVPWVAPQAYLHIVFKGADRYGLREVGDKLGLPEGWRNVLEIQNGAILFSGSISLYGVHAPGAFLNRSDFFNRMPFSIEGENRSWPPKDRGAQVAIGGYSYDGTRAVLDLAREQVAAMPRKSTTVLENWLSAESWVKTELQRLRTMFDNQGKILVAEADTLPTRVN